MTRNLILILGASALVALILVLVRSRGEGGSPSFTAREGGTTTAPSAAARRPALLPPARDVVRPEGFPEPERAAAASSPGELSVLVLDRDRGTPLADVPLRLRRVEPASTDESVTGPEGRCRFVDLPAAEYRLEPMPAGDLDYAADPTPISLGDAAREEVVVRVERRWFLTGTVVQVDRETPIPDVQLLARDSEGKRSHLATSDRDGRFRSRESFPAGVVTVLLPPTDTMGLLRTLGDGPELLQVTVGQDDASGLTIELGWVGVLRGVVLDSSDRPIPAAEVRVLGADSIYLRSPDLRFWALHEGMRFAGRTARTDREGGFRIHRLPDDRALVLVASAQGFATGRSSDLLPPFLEGDDPVELRLVSGGSIAGQVLDAGGAAMPDVAVSALSRDADHQPDPTRTDVEGMFRLQGLHPGATEVTARGHQGDGRSHVVATGQVVVTPGAEARLVLQAGADGVHLSGVAVDQHDRPITSDRMRLSVRTTPIEPLPGEQSWGTDTPVHSDGTFQVTVPREGRYRLTLLSGTAGDGWESQDVQAPVRDLRLTYTIAPTSMLTVRALDATSGDPIDEGNIAVAWDRGSLGMNFHGGERATLVREGLYTLTVDAKGYAPSSRKLDLRGRLRPDTLVEVHLERGRSLSGIVVDNEGQPVKGCAVALRASGMLQLESLVYSGADGRFTIEAAPVKGGSVCVIDEAYRILATAEIDAGDVTLTLDGH